MSTPPLAGIQAARALLDEEGRGDQSTADVVMSLNRACATLYARLAPWIGADGCTRLISRAIALAAVAHPALTGATVSADPPHLEGIDEMSKLSAGKSRAAAETFVACVFEHLGRLVGEAVALRVLLPETPEHWGIAPVDGDGR